MTELLYLTDSYLRTCVAQVTGIDGEKVTLDRTIFYPTGGGQEHDEGTLRQGDQLFQVFKVKKEDGIIQHYVRNSEQLKPCQVTAELNWERRYGLMRHHSLLHVLGAVMYNKYEALSTGNNIYPHRARIDFQGVADLSEQALAEIVTEANNMIAGNHPITTRSVSREEAERRPGAIKTAISLLPPAVKTVRLVTIEGIDEQACGGTHVNTTGEIGSFAITKVKSKGKNNKRIEVTIL